MCMVNAGPERMGELQRELASLAPRHTLFMQTAMVPVSLRSLLCNASDMHHSLDQSVSAGMGEPVPLSALHGAAVVCLVGIGHPQVRAGTCVGGVFGFEGRAVDL